MNISSKKELDGDNSSDYKRKKVFSPQPIRNKSIFDSTILFRSAVQNEHASPIKTKKYYSLENITFEAMPNEVSSFSLLPTLNQIEEIGEEPQNHYKNREVQENISLIDRMRKECPNPQHKDPFFENIMNDVFFEEGFEIDA